MANAHVRLPDVVVSLGNAPLLDLLTLLPPSCNKLTFLLLDGRVLKPHTMQSKNWRTHTLVSIETVNIFTSAVKKIYILICVIAFLH